MRIDTHIAIVGAGPVGLFGAFQAGMLGMTSTIIDVLETAGGQCSALYPGKPIYDIPAHPMISGQDLVEQLMQQCAPFKPTFRFSCLVRELESLQDGGYRLVLSDGCEVFARAVIISAGCGAFSPNKPPLEGIAMFEGRSVFYSVTDKRMFAGKRVVIGGGGDSALDWAVELASIAQKVYLVHRRDNFRAAEGTVAKLESFRQSGAVEFVTPCQLHSLEGEDGRLRIVRVATLDGVERELEADFLLPFFGLKMNIGPIANWGLALEGSHIQANPVTMETNVKGVFAAGDIATYPGKLKLILTGFAEIAVACHNAYAYAFPGKALHFQYSTAQGVPGV